MPNGNADRRLTRLTDAKSLRVPSLELVDICPPDRIERNAERVGGRGETPQDIAQFFGESLDRSRPLLKDVLAHESEHLASFLGETSRGVQEPFIAGERRILRSQRSALILVERHE
jgi:hypothetical protein